MSSQEVNTGSFDFHSYVQTVSEAAVETGSSYHSPHAVTESLDFIQWKAQSVPEASLDHFLYLVNWNVGIAYAVDMRHPPESSLAFFNGLPRDVAQANILTGLGEDLGKNAEPARSRFFFNEAAKLFETIYSHTPAEDLAARAQLLDEEYLRMANLQHAVDPQGAQRTALSIADHLLVLRRHASEDQSDVPALEMLDEAMLQTLDIIGSLESPQAKSLLMSIENPRLKERAVRHMVEQFADSLLQAEQFEAAVKTLRAHSSSEIPLHGVWRYIADKVEAKPEAVEELLDTVDRHYPGLYNQADDVTAMGPMFEALYAAKQEHSLAVALQAWERQHLGQQLEQFAFSCGYDNDGERLSIMLETISANDVRTECARHYYTLGLAAARKATETSA